MFPDSSPARTFPPEDNRIPVLPADSPHTATQIAIPLRTGSHCALVARAIPPYALPARHPPPPLQSAEPAARPAPPTASPAFRSSDPQVLGIVPKLHHIE